MLPAYYEFTFPVKIVSGHTALDSLPGELQQAHARRPLVITDEGVSQAGLIKVLLGAFADSEITIGALYDQVPLESSTLVVNELAALYRAKECDSLIAVGGGSVIDTGKGVNILASLGGDDVRDYEGAEVLHSPLNPFYVVPTTAGTGSEATNSAVIIDPDKGLKMLFVSEQLIPRAAVLDTRMTMTLPPRLTAATGMDALAHAMEAYIGIQKNPMSDAYAWQAVRLISTYLPRVIRSPGYREGRLAMANASTMAGVAFSNSMVGCVHSLGHAAGAIDHIPHGVAMNIFLPFGLEFNLSRREAEIAELLFPMAGPEVYASTPPEKRAYKTIEMVRALKEDLYSVTGLARNLKEAGLERHKLDQIAMMAINDATWITNPEELRLEDARRILEEAYG